LQNARERAGRVDSESWGALPEYGDGLVNQENEKTGIERHYGKQVALITSNPPGRVQVGEESYPEEDRSRKEKEDGVQRTAKGEPTPMPNNY
jgi:hypothetical protein